MVEGKLIKKENKNKINFRRDLVVSSDDDKLVVLCCDGSERNPTNFSGCVVRIDKDDSQSRKVGYYSTNWVKLFFTKLPANQHIELRNVEGK